MTVHAIEESISKAARLGIAHVVAQDDRLDGRTVVIEGARVLNFSSCSYLGMELHPAVQQAVADAADRYGTQFSMSRGYMSSPEYPAAENALSVLFGRPALISTSTTMGSVATIPTLVEPGDVILLDAQVHASVKLAAKLAKADGVEVQTVPHSNMTVLDQKIRELSQEYRRVWYMVDGLYSMFGDLPPADELNRLFEKHEKLWLYSDDAHAVSWYGEHGRGYTLEHLSETAKKRSVVVASLCKSFGVGGGVLTFPDEEMRRKVFTCGLPMLFSGPMQPPMLGGIRASAELHMTGEVEARRERLRELIRFFNARAVELGLPLVSLAETPIRCVAAGSQDAAFNLAKRLRKAGFFVNFASYPAVPANRSGLRIVITTHHSEADIEALLEAIADNLPRALADENYSFAELKRAFHRQFAGREVALRELEPAPLEV